MCSTAGQTKQNNKANNDNLISFMYTVATSKRNYRQLINAV